MKKLAFMFPGQGSQTVGMGKAFYDYDQDTKALFEQADDILEDNLSEVMFAGPKETLTETENAQPALLLSSIAVYQLLEKEHIQPDVVVGHSLGEYSALVAAGALDFKDAIKLVRERGRLMEQAFPKGQGTMAAVLGATKEEIENVLVQISDEVVDIANLNCPGQVVISGSKEGIDMAASKLKEAGVKRVIPLNVSGPFHSRLMEDASKQFAKTLNTCKVSDAIVPVYANVTAAPVMKHEEISDLLVRQLYSPVRFHESIEHMIEAGVEAFVEVGNGKVLNGLVKKINRKIPTFHIQDMDTFQAFISWYKEES